MSHAFQDNLLCKGLNSPFLLVIIEEKNRSQLDNLIYNVQDFLFCCNKSHGKKLLMRWQILFSLKIITHHWEKFCRNDFMSLLHAFPHSISSHQEIMSKQRKSSRNYAEYLLLMTDKVMLTLHSYKPNPNSAVTSIVLGK